MRILCAESLQARNSLALPSTADALASVSTLNELDEALEYASRRNLSVVPLGEGSNIVFADDLKGLALCLANRGIERLDENADEVVLRITAGENWHKLVQWSLDQGYCGLENLALIPGLVGAAPIQNIGAYGVELCSMLEQVHAVEIQSGRRISLAVKECELAYRDSVFKGRLRDQLVITAVDIKLSRWGQTKFEYPALADYLQEQGVARPLPKDVFEAVVAIRSSKLPDPAVQPNAGSFFKNPLIDAKNAEDLRARFPELPVYSHSGGQAKLPAAWLIDQCGWKGHREGGVGVHPDHALVLVNYGGAHGRDILALADKISGSVVERFGVALEIEPRVYGR